MNGDYLHGDPGYSWDDYIEAWRIEKKRLAGKVCLNGAQKCLPPIRIPRPNVSPPLIFDEKYPLTDKNSIPTFQG